MSGHDHIALDAAQRAVLEHARPLASERLALQDALGRVLAETVTAPIDLPPFANSAMDGFAVRAADTAECPVRLSLVGESRAGRPAERPLEPGTAIAISTGATMPQGADAVVRVEDVIARDGEIELGATVAAGTDVRPAGDDVTSGTAVLTAGLRAGAGELAMAAACGLTELTVQRPPRVNIVATGDELVPGGQPLGPGQIHDSNSTMLAALVRESGAEVGRVITRVGDSESSAGTAIGDGLEAADVLVTCGGVSVGRHDHVKGALDRLGAREVFWQVALRPGHPTWFGTLPREDAPPMLIFGLPGNPVSAWVTFQLFVAPALRTLEGLRGRPLRIDARYAGPEIGKRAGFTQVLRCRLISENGEPAALLTAENQKSHALSSLVGGNCLGFLDQSLTRLQPGDTIPVQPPVVEYT